VNTKGKKKSAFNAFFQKKKDFFGFLKSNKCFLETSIKSINYSLIDLDTVHLLAHPAVPYLNQRTVQIGRDVAAHFHGIGRGMVGTELELDGYAAVWRVLDYGCPGCH
jgi:hypothetical protein